MYLIPYNFVAYTKMLVECIPFYRDRLIRCFHVLYITVMSQLRMSMFPMITRTYIYNNLIFSF